MFVDGGKKFEGSGKGVSKVLSEVEVIINAVRESFVVVVGERWFEELN